MRGRSILDAATEVGRRGRRHAEEETCDGQAKRGEFPHGNDPAKRAKCSIEVDGIELDADAIVEHRYEMTNAAT